MDIIIAGSGRVGLTLARQLAAEGHDLTIIDEDFSVLESSMERLDVGAVHGNCASLEVLEQAGVKDAELLIAVTSADEVNLLCCTTAHGINPNLHTIARIRNPEYTEQIFRLRHIFGLSMAINPEKQAAAEIHRLLKYPGFLKRDVFAKGRTEIVELKIDVDSKLCGVSLIEMSGMLKRRVLVCAVLRDGNAIVPGGHFRLQAGDRIFVTAPTENLAALLKGLGIITHRVKDCLLCGGGTVAYYLADMLRKSGIKTRIIEDDAARCAELCELLPDADISCGDCGDMEVLEQEGLTDYDAIVTMTGHDELNMIASLYAGSQKVPQVITKIADKGSNTIINSLGLGSVICPKELCCNDIIRYVRAMQNQTGAALSVHAIADGQVEALEFLVDANTENCGIPLKQLKTKPNVLIASIGHGSKTEIPNGDSVFQQGDSMVVIASGRGSIRQINDIFA